MIEYARLRGNHTTVEALEKMLEELGFSKKPLYHVSGFAHPELLAFTNESSSTPVPLQWGLVPTWTKSAADAKKVRTQTLNARGETIFEKPSFRGPAKSRRCLIYVDAFYEHHHANKQTYPFRIAMKDGTPMIFAGLWEEWVDKESGEIHKTCSIVTTVGNPLMAKIHNNPKAEMGPRMPVILLPEQQDEWLIECKTELDKQHLVSLIKPLPPELLQAHTVGRLQGKNAIGNIPEVRLPFSYPDLSLSLDF